MGENLHLKPWLIKTVAPAVIVGLGSFAAGVEFDKPQHGHTDSGRVRVEVDNSCIDPLDQAFSVLANKNRTSKFSAELQAIFMVNHGMRLQEGNEHFSREFPVTTSEGQAVLSSLIFSINETSGNVEVACKK